MMIEYELQKAVLILSSRQYRGCSYWCVVATHQFDNGTQGVSSFSVCNADVHLTASEAIEIARFLDAHD